MGFSGKTPARALWGPRALAHGARAVCSLGGLEPLKRRHPAKNEPYNTLIERRSLCRIGYRPLRRDICDRLVPPCYQITDLPHHFTIKNNKILKRGIESETSLDFFCSPSPGFGWTPRRFFLCSVTDPLMLPALTRGAKYAK